MHQGGFRRWLWLPGALAAAALLGTGCERDKPTPKAGGAYEGVANEQQPTESFVPGVQPERPRQGGWADPGSRQPPATGGSGIGDEQQGANPSPDEFRRPQQVPVQREQDRTGARGEPGIGAPGFTTPQEQETDLGGTRRYEEQRGHGNSTQQPGAEQGPRSPPETGTQEQAPKQ